MIHNMNDSDFKNNPIKCTENLRKLNPEKYSQKGYNITNLHFYILLTI